MPTVGLVSRWAVAGQVIRVFAGYCIAVFHKTSIIFIYLPIPIIMRCCRPRLMARMVGGV